METALKGLGFKVDKVLNGNLERMENAVLNLKRRLSVSRNSYGFSFMPVMEFNPTEKIT
jgi:hypothetical protein